MSIAAETVPVLPRGVRVHEDRVRGMTVLLAPERVVKLDAIGAAILAETDGATPFAAIVSRLAARYGAPEEQVAIDAGRFLASLAERRMLDLAP